MNGRPKAPGRSRPSGPGLAGSGEASPDWEMIWSLTEADAPEGGGESQSRSASTYGSIKKMILTGQVGPGFKLAHEDLAEVLQVSRTPVRESLERLYQEGFVTRLPHRGFYVAGITKDEAFELYSAREGLELFALQLSMKAGVLDEAAMARLSARAASYERFSASPSPTNIVLTDVLFHLELARLSANRYLVRLLAQTLERIAMKRRHQGYHPARSLTAAAEHRGFLDALARNDRREAPRLLRNHIVAGRDALMSQLADEPQPLG